MFTPNTDTPRQRSTSSTVEYQSLIIFITVASSSTSQAFVEQCFLLREIFQSCFNVGAVRHAILSSRFIGGGVVVLESTCSAPQVLSILPNQPVRNQWNYREKIFRLKKKKFQENQATIYSSTEILTTSWQSRTGIFGNGTTRTDRSKRTTSGGRPL